MNRNWFTILILSCIILPIAFISCREKKVNSPPVASLYVSPTSGEVPLPVNITLSGTDPDGVSDIKTYKLNIGTEVITSDAPISITRNFDSPGTIVISGTVIDSEKATSSDTKSVNLYKGPYIDQIVSLVNDVELNYSATLSKVSNAKLTINKDGVLFATKDLSDIVESGYDFTKTFNFAIDGLTKGNYEFILKSDNLEQKNLIVVPNYTPTVDLSNVKPNLKEYTELNVTLPAITDKNPEDNNAAYTSVKSLDNKTQLTLNGNILNVKTIPKSTGAYQAELTFGSSTGGTAKGIIQGIITPETRIIVYPYTQPNDSTLNWYGSGDVNKDNIVDSKDLTRLIEIINNTYSNPNDLRLMDRSDVDGNGLVNSTDKTLLEKKLNGVINYLPGEWNKLTTRTEREDWIKKMLAIDKTETYPFSGGADCKQYSNQLMINFRGFNNSDIQKFLRVYPYDIKDNGRFNLPMLEVSTGEYDEAGAFIYGHLWNTIIVGNDAYVWNDLCNIEPQADLMNVQPGQGPFFKGINTSFHIRGPPIILGSNVIDMQDYYGFNIKNYIPVISSWESPNIKFLNKR